ncbi:MAG: phage tail protein [Candidatus Heimdallarchaeaceae archaeon]
MAQFQVNSDRVDPYKNYKFLVKWEDGSVVAGISKVSGLKRTTEVVEHRIGGDQSTNRKAPGPNKYEPITLERGVTHDPEFEEWANKVHNYKGDSEMSLKDFRRTIRLEFLNEQHTTVIAYNIFRCWVSEYNALPELDAKGNAVAIQSIVLQNEGWERDVSITEPTET